MVKKVTAACVVAITLLAIAVPASALAPLAPKTARLDVQGTREGHRRGGAHRHLPLISEDDASREYHPARVIPPAGTRANLAQGHAKRTPRARGARRDGR